MKKKILVLLYIFALFYPVVYAQKVGLVLSGGGAKGLAHIGVIKALEENNIPIDYIAGTSMGAIIGGLYAAGYSVEEMEKIFKSPDILNWLDGVIQSPYKYYYKQLDENSSFYDLDFFRNVENIKSLLSIKMKSTGQLDFIFMQLFGPAGAVCQNNFDHLFIPFRCVATDIYHSEAVVLKSGDLGTAVKASMSLPFYFKPVEMDSCLLFDGGLINNFPVNVMQNEFHPELIIGSTVEFTNKKIKDNFFHQMENIITKKSAYIVPDSLGFTIQSPVSGYDLFDILKLDSIEKAGYESALKMMDKIKTKIASRPPERDLQKERELFRQKMPPLLFNHLVVTGVASLQRNYISHSLFQKEHIIPIENVKHNFFKLLAENKLKSLQPYAKYTNDGYYTLNLKVEPRKPFSFEVGGYFSLTDVNEGYLGFNYRLYANKPVELQSDIQFGRFYTSFLFGPRIEFINNRPFSIDLVLNKSMLNYFSGSSELFYGDKSTYTMRNNNSIRLNLNFPLKDKGKWEFGGVYSIQEDNYFQNNQYTRTDIPDQTVFNSFSVYGKLESGELNKKQYPTEGSFITLKTSYTTGKELEYPGTANPEISYFEKDHSFLTAHLDYEKYFKLFPSKGKGRFLHDSRLGVEVESYYSTKQLFHNYTATLITSNVFSPTVNSTIRYLPFLRSNSFAAGGLKAILPISSTIHLRLEGYYFQPFNEVQTDQNNHPFYTKEFFAPYHFMGCGGLVVHTMLGPATILLNTYDQGIPKYFLQVSFGYLLNNKQWN